MGCIPWADRYMIRPLSPRTRNGADHALGAAPQKGDSTHHSAALASPYITYQPGGSLDVRQGDNAYESRAVVVRGGEPVEKDTGQQATNRHAATADKRLCTAPANGTSGASHAKDWEHHRNLDVDARNPRPPYQGKTPLQRKDEP